MLLSENDSTKEKIALLLSHVWPLTAKKIYRRLQKKHDIAISYQAVHKALQELLNARVLKKHAQGYQLNEDWIYRLEEFTKSVQDKYTLLTSQKTNILHKLTFKQHSAFIKYHLNFIQELIHDEQKLQMTFHFRHVPYPNAITREDYEKLKPLLPKITWVILSRESTELDRWCAKHWRRIGVTVKLGADIATDSMLIVMNDYIISLYLPEKAKRAWDKIFSVSHVNEANMIAMVETLLDQTFKTTATIFKDKEIAAFLKE